MIFARPGALGPQGRQHDYDLHACPQPGGRQGRPEPARRAVRTGRCGSARAPDNSHRRLTVSARLRAIPHEVNVIHHEGVDLYSDPGLTRKIEGARGVILETEGPEGAVKRLRIFPSTRSHFRKGMRVSWEWSPEHMFEQTWYRDPDTGGTRVAWTGAMEFIGRDVDSV